MIADTAPGFHKSDRAEPGFDPHLRAADPIPDDHSPPVGVKSTPLRSVAQRLPPAHLTPTGAEQLASYRIGGSPWPQPLRDKLPDISKPIHPPSAHRLGRLSSAG
ncbi:hypothetical protein GCM10011575_43980 [Microlunatus endophyticus]|uniref:Uncharacterized protein n=1 Tax=Microlunatus endophyticus TaxID=1716077 RepID=A0A917SHV9_9ACTN|nr:hypothetical protein GCM10011575_43980 [Microlunatus endophyticus]